MKTILDQLYEARDMLNNTEAEYERNPIPLQDAIIEAVEAIDKAIAIMNSD